VESLAGLDPRGAPDSDYLPGAAPTPRHDTARERGPRWHCCAGSVSALEFCGTHSLSYCSIGRPRRSTLYSPTPV